MPPKAWRFQTIANAYLAISNDLVIIPVINKIDLPSADVEGSKSKFEMCSGLSSEEAFLVSAKDGRGVKEVLEGVVKIIPPPAGSIDQPLKALILTPGSTIIRARWCFFESWMAKSPQYDD